MSWQGRVRTRQQILGADLLVVAQAISASGIVPYMTAVSSSSCSCQLQHCSMHLFVLQEW